MTFDDETLQSNELLNPRVSDLDEIISNYARINQEVTDALSLGQIVINQIRNFRLDDEEAKSSDLNRLFLTFHEFIGGKFRELEELTDKVYEV